MKRKDFLKTTGLVSLSSFFNPGEFLTKNRQIQKTKIKPPVLKPGDTVGLISPGSSITESELENCISNLAKLELKTFFLDEILAKHGYLGGTDQQRANEINYMFADGNIKGIVAARGGYGCNRILPMLEYELIKNNPKALVGYSDITALLFALYSQSSLVSFHGPVGISTFNDYSIEYFRNSLMKNSTGIDLLSAKEDEQRDDEAYKIYVINEGLAEGELAGGNLSIAASLLGTPYDVDYRGKLLFFEDVGEEPYRIDRMITELLLAGKLQQAAGIALGVFIDCEIDDKKPAFKDSFTLKEVMFDRLGNLGVPVIYGLSFGHITNKFTIPFGINARLDTTNQKLTLLESCVE